MPAGFYEGKPNDYGVAEGGKAIQGAVAAIGGIFQQRYQQKQYSDFLEGPQKDYENKLHSVSDLLLDEDNDEGPSQAIKMMSSALSTYMDEAGRYRNNPLIAGRAHEAFVGNNTMLEQLFTSRFDAQKAGILQQKANTEQQKAEASIGETEARTGLLKAQTEGIKTGAIGVTPSGRLGKGTGKGSKATGAAFLTGGQGQIDPNLSPEQQAAQAYAIGSANLTNPGSGAAQKAQESEIAAVRRSLAQQTVADRAGTGEQRTWIDQTGQEKSEPWDPSNKNHVDEAMATLVDPEDARNAYLYGKMMEESPMTGVRPDVVQKQYGWLKDPSLANPNNPITREMSEPNVGKVLLGSEGWSRLTDPKTKKQPLDLTDAAKRLPDDYEDLEGPMRRGLDAVKGTIMSGAAKPQNAKDVQDLIETALLAYVHYSIGGGHENAKVNEGVRHSRVAAAHFAEAIAAKYAQSVGVQTGIIKEEDVPKGKSMFSITNDALSKHTPLGDFEENVSGAYEGTKGLINKIRE